MKRTVFISHSSADKAVAGQVCEYLEKHGVSCWIAPRDVTPGKNYGAAIVDAIDECRVFVLILSGESNKSHQVVREVERAASADSVILPFRIEDVQPSRDIAFYVSSAHWLDAAGHPVREQYDELLAAIENWQKAEQTSESGPTVAPPVPPSPAAPAGVTASGKRSFPLWLLLLIGAAVIVILGFALLHRTHEAANGVTATSPSPEATPSPSPTATATPANEISPTPTPAPTTTPPVSPTPTPIRRRPGDRIQAGSREASPLPSPTIAGNAAEALPNGPNRPVIKEIAATSQLNSEYRPNYAFDDNAVTGWAPKGRGLQQTLFVHFQSPTEIRSVSILNGDGRDEERYRATNRVKTLRIVLSDGTNQLLKFQDELKTQRFELRQPVRASWASLEIVSIFPGSKFNWTVISDIAFNEE